MKKQIYLLLCLAVVACNSKPKSTRPFDLAKLTLTENLTDLMAAQEVKPEAKDTTDETMLGYEVFKSHNPKVLRFAGTGLSGLKNHVLFHYNEKALAGYELLLYNQAQTDKLIGLLDNVGSLVFKQTKLPKGSIAIDLNEYEIKPENMVRKTYRVWENKSTGLSYFLSENGSGKDLTTELIVVNKSTQFGKDWIATRQLDWYKNEKSE